MIRRLLALCLLALVLSPCTAPFQTWWVGNEFSLPLHDATRALLLLPASAAGQSSVAPPPRVRTTVADAPAVLKIVALSPEIVTDTARPATQRHDDLVTLALNGHYWPRLVILRV